MAWIIGTRRDDAVNGTHRNDIIITGKGSDTINGGGGHDLILSGRGADSIDGGAGNDIILSGKGADTVDGGSGHDLILSGRGADSVDGGSGHDVILAGSGSDTVDGGAGHDYVNLGRGNDTAIFVAAENTGSFDIYDGGRGNDRLELHLTAAEYADPGILNDILTYLDVIDAGYTECYFCFGSLKLYVRSFEELAVLVDGVEVDPRADGPVANPDQVTTNEDTAATFPSVLDNDDIAEGVDTVVLVSGPAKGAFTFSADGTYAFDPAGDFEALAVGESETVTFTYEVTDTTGATAIGTASIVVLGRNDAPVALAVADTVDEDEPGITVAADFTDVDASDTHTFTVDTTGTLGNVVNNNDGTFDYDPNGAFEALAVGETATDTFSYTVDDGNGGTASEIVTITVTGQNDAPVAVAAAGTVAEDGPGITVAAGFTDVDASDTHTFSVDTTGTLGSVVNNGDGTFDYDPNGAFEALAEGETATDTFTYTVDDGNGGTSTETVTLTVTGQNDAPAALAVADNVDEDGPSITVSANFSDADASDTHTFSVETTGTLGSVTNNNDGTFDYDPNGAFEALAEGETVTDTFTYTVDDGNGGTSTETVTITVTGQNDAPVALEVTDTVDEDGPGITISADFSDVDASDTHTFSVDTTGTLGAVTNNGDGTFDYDPNGAFEALAEGETATDTFTYTVDDGNGGTSTETVTITVTGQNDAPVALEVTDTVDEDGPGITISSAFSDVDASDLHTFSVDTTGSLGAVTNNANGTFDYDPNGAFEVLAEGETATDTFTYTVDDGNGVTSTEIETITVTGQNDAPVTLEVIDAVDEDGPCITVSANFSDVDTGDTHTCTRDTTGIL
ncbi:MAG: Ig-like domain-containing protein, partial [Paracoccaceae bacterium]